MPKSLTGRGGGPQHSKVVKEECFRSATSISHLMKTMNFLDLFENLALNEYSKKLLPQAILIKQHIMNSSTLREKYYASKKRINNTEIHFKGDFGENEEEKESESEEGGNDNHTLISEKKIATGIDNEYDDIKHSLRSYIQSHINMRALNNLSRRKTHAKSPPRSLEANPEAEIIFNIPKAKNYGQQGIMSRGSNKLIRSMKSEQNHGSQGSQKSSPPPQKHLVRDDRQPQAPSPKQS